MSAVEQYEELKARAIGVVQDALPQIANGLCEEIKRMAEQNVYSYGATPEAMAKRRGDIGSKENLEITIDTGGLSVEIKNVTPMQGTDYGVSEVNFVEAGLANYNQPYARPFMEEAKNEYIAKDELISIIRAAGFDVY